MNITYVDGDATNPEGKGPRIIVHVCNDIGAWGRGFVLALSKKWKQPEQQYRAWVRGEVDLPFGLGQVQFVQIEDGLWVANLLGQHDIRRRGSMPPVRYEAIRQGAFVHMPRIGGRTSGRELEHDQRNGSR